MWAGWNLAVALSNDDNTKISSYVGLLLLLLLFFDPGTRFPANENNYDMQYKKYKNQAGMNLTPPPPSQNSHAVRWHCIAESERRVAEIKSWFLCLLLLLLLLLFYTPGSKDPRGWKLQKLKSKCRMVIASEIRQVNLLLLLLLYNIVCEYQTTRRSMFSTLFARGHERYGLWLPST